MERKQIRKQARRILWSGVKLVWHGALVYARTGAAGPQLAAAAYAADKAVSDIQERKQ